MYQSNYDDKTFDEKKTKKLYAKTEARREKKKLRLAFSPCL